MSYNAPEVISESKIKIFLGGHAAPHLFRQILVLSPLGNFSKRSTVVGVTCGVLLVFQF